MITVTFMYLNGRNKEYKKYKKGARSIQEYEKYFS